jgi:hypothetical protein
MIGPFNDTGLVFGVLPACLQLGSNPASFNSGSFAIYNGPAGGGITGELIGGYTYNNGSLLTNGYNQVLKINNWVPSVDSIHDFTIVMMLDTNTKWIYSNGYLWGIVKGTNLFYSSFTDQSWVPRFVRILYIGNNWPTSGNTEYSSKSPALDTGINTLSWVKTGTNKMLDFYYGSVKDLAPTYAEYSFDYSTPTDFSGSYFGVGNVNTVPVNGCQYALKSFFYYNRALPQSEIQTLTALGPTLGGIKGYDNGDETMKLMSMRNWFIM